MNNSRLKVWTPLLFSLVLILGMFIGYQLKNSGNGAGFFSAGNNAAVEEVVDLIKAKYVDTLNIDSISEKAIDQILSQLDPHSVYIPAKALADINDEMEGNFQGIGVVFQLINDTANIISVLKNSPAEKSGLLIGDKILLANDTVSLIGKKKKEADIRNQIRGKSGSTLKLLLLRENVKKEVSIQRANIPISAIDAAYIIAPATGYIRLGRFSERCYEEFMQSLEQLQKQGMKSLVFDLRGNGGGLLQQAAAIADEFLDEDKLVVFTKGNKSDRFEYHCRKDGLFEKGKLVVLIDETSASASEVLAGALQDWDRATIIGRRSFGKGLVQQQFSLSNGAALRLTVAKYYTPLGRNIQKPFGQGITKYQEEIYSRYHDGVRTDTITPKSPSFKTALGHIVFGGGGISPDVYIPVDTTIKNNIAAELFYHGILSDFSYIYFMQHKASILSAKNTQSLIPVVLFQDKDWKDLQSLAAKDSIQISSFTETDKAEILTKVTALLSKQIWGSSSFFEEINKKDKTVLKALEVLSK